MKKLMTYIAVFIVITAFMLLFFIRNFPAEMAELSLDGIANPNQIDRAMVENSIYDYFNVYDTFVRGENANVYTGNINILLRKSDIKAGAMTYSDDEVIMGDKHMEENFKYNLLGERYESQFGEYYVNCIIKNSDKVYYRDLNILQNVNIKSQRLYMSLVNEKKLPMKYEQVISTLRYYNIGISKSIYYSDAINFFKKLLILLIIAEFTIIFLKFLNRTKKSIVALSESRKSSQYDLTLREFIFKSNNVKSILKILSQVIILTSLGIAMMWLTVVILKISTSYVIDYTSLKSIMDAVGSFISFMNYCLVNGFTDISSSLMSCIIIYLLTVFTILVINVKEFFVKLKGKRKLTI